MDRVDRIEGAVLDEPQHTVETARALGTGGSADDPRRPSRLLRARLIAGRISGVCGWLYLLLALGLWGLLLGADLWWPATLFLFSPRWLAAVPVVLLAPAAALLQRRALTPLLAGFVVVAGPVMGFCVPWQRLLATAPDGMHLRLLTCNMHYHTEGSVPLERLVAAARPDIVLLQEWRGSEESPAFCRGAWHTHDVRGLFLASAFPVRRATPYGDDSTGEKGLIMHYELDTPAGMINVFSLHLASPRAGLARMIHARGRAPADLETETDRKSVV